MSDEILPKVLGIVGGLLVLAIWVYKGTVSDYVDTLIRSLTIILLCNFLFAFTTPSKRITPSSINQFISFSKQSLKFYTIILLIFTPTIWAMGFLEFNQAITQYPAEITRYTKLVDEPTNLTTIEKAKRIVSKYRQEFNDCWGKVCPLPARMYVYRYSIPIFNDTEYGKLIVVEKWGLCYEFAAAIRVLLNETLHIPTRIVQLSGPKLDHAIPEAYINGSWQVFDYTWTTKNPVKAEDYYTYLWNNRARDSFRKVICATVVRDAITGEDLKKEHGFPDKPDPNLCGN